MRACVLIYLTQLAKLYPMSKKTCKSLKSGHFRICMIQHYLSQVPKHNGNDFMLGDLHYNVDN